MFVPYLDNRLWKWPFPAEFLLPTRAEALLAPRLLNKP